MTERSCAAAISAVKIRISGRCSHYTRYIAFHGATKSYSVSCEHSLRRQNNNLSRASHCFVHFFFVVTRLRRENYGGRKQATTKFYSLFAHHP